MTINRAPALRRFHLRGKYWVRVGRIGAMTRLTSADWSNRSVVYQPTFRRSVLDRNQSVSGIPCAGINVVIGKSCSNRFLLAIFLHWCSVMM